jgi:hypothetical protein
MLEKIRNWRIVNLLQRMPKHEVSNSKNLNVITRSSAKKEGSLALNKTLQINPIRKDNWYTNPQKER